MATEAQLLIDANIIKNEVVANANDATRVGQMLDDFIVSIYAAALLKAGGTMTGDIEMGTSVLKSTGTLELQTGNDFLDIKGAAETLRHDLSLLVGGGPSSPIVVTWQNTGGVPAYLADLLALNLSDVLSVLNETSGNDIIVSTGDIISLEETAFISYEDSGNTLAVKTQTLSGARIVEYRDQGGEVSLVNTPTVHTPTGTTQTIDFKIGTFQTIDLASATGNVTLTLSNPTAGETYLLKVIQDATTPRDLVYPATVKWAGGTAPVISTGATEIDTVVLSFDGTNYYAAINQNYS